MVWRESEGQVKGITSAAALFTVVAIGVVAGSGHSALAIGVTALILVDLELRHVPLLKHLEHDHPPVRIAVIEALGKSEDPSVKEPLFRAAYDADLDAYRFYRLRPRRIKLFDEHALGGATWVTVAVGAGGRLRWVRTESYV